MGGAYSQSHILGILILNLLYLITIYDCVLLFTYIFSHFSVLKLYVLMTFAGTPAQME